MYNFDNAPNRKGTGCFKWDFADMSFGGKDILPMWVADMDFETAQPIIDGIQRSLKDVVYGYGVLTDKYYDSVISWFKRKHNLDVKKEWIVTIPGVVTALRYSVQILSEVGDEIIIPTPVYAPFYNAVEDFGRIAIKSSLVWENGKYTFDFEDIERKITSKTKAIMICSPHNPTGRVWDKEELARICEICERHNIYIIDDEIHNDLVFEKEHIIIGKISKDSFERSIICTAPSKTFNIAGIPASNIIIKNDKIRDKFIQIVRKSHNSVCSAIVEPVVCAAYDNCEEWLEEALKYMRENAKYFVSRVENEIPNLRVYLPEGTYLMWVDFRGTGKSHEDIKNILVNQCSLGFNNGKEYGTEGEGFFRVNLACPRSFVEEAINRLKKVFA